MGVGIGGARLTGFDKGVQGEGEKHTPVERLAQYWNTLPHVCHHRDDTVIFASGKRRLRQLLSGKWKDWGLNRTWLAQEGVPWKWVKDMDRWPEASIRTGLKRLSHLLSPEYHPRDKDYLVRTLSGALFNPYKGGTSWFLRVMYLPPVLVEQQPKQDVKRDVALGIELLRQTVIACRKGVAAPDDSMIPSVVNAVYAEYAKLPWKRRPQLEQWFPVRYRLLKDYAEFLPRYYVHWDDLRVHNLFPGRPVWYTFLKGFQRSTQIPILNDGKG